MTDRNLKLNGLSRYTKQSPRLVLEEYGHCEVPAGCGGVVLRWRQPDQPIPMRVRFFSGNGTHEYQGIDGTDTRFSSKVLVSYGTHTLSFILRDVDPQFACVLLTGTFDADYLRILQPQGDTMILSLPDGSWTYTLEAPTDAAWQHPDFDDTGWLLMSEKPVIAHSPMYGDNIAYWTQDKLDLGAKPLGIDVASSLAQRVNTWIGRSTLIPAVFIRKTFTLHTRESVG